MDRIPVANGVLMEKVHLTEEKATMLGTLWGRAVDSERPEPILGDTAAAAAVRRIDYDFDSLGMNRDMSLSVAMRAKYFDRLTGEFLRAHPDATVLHLGCGLDTRVYRLDPPPSVAWFDVDYPEVVSLREKLLPAREGYRMIGSSVSDPAWLREVPADRPTVMVAEGLTMYLPTDHARWLLRGIAHRFPQGQLIFDTFSRLGVRAANLNPVIRRTGSTLHFSVDDPRELESLGLTFVDQLDATTFAEDGDLDLIGPKMRLQTHVSARIPAVRRMGRILRYRF